MQHLRERLVLRRYVHHGKAESAGELADVAPSATGFEEQHATPRHERRPDERIRAAFFVIAVDHDESRPDTEKRRACGFLRLREARRVSRELDRGSQECGGERI